MKKIVALLLAALLLLSMTACGKQQTPVDNDPQTETTGQSAQTPTETQNQETVSEEWGVEGKISTRKNQNTVAVYFKWPHYYGMPALAGDAGLQEDGTFVLVDRYKSGYSPEDVALKDFYPAYLEQTVASYADFYGTSYNNAQIVVGEGQMETIGEYEVIKYAGQHIYNMQDRHYEHNIIVYATIVKKNESIIYWLIEDMTEDQSSGQLMKDHAVKIIQSIEEN